MKKKSTPRTSGIKITDDIRGAWKDRDKTLGRYYRPIKTQITVRIDREILDWLKSKGAGHLTRINEILRERMTAERGSRG